jgi:poly-gamma-glutamate synthesis protein (capsule biosynthesis protein)
MMRRVILWSWVTVTAFLSTCQATPSQTLNPINPYPPTRTPFQPVAEVNTLEEIGSQSSAKMPTPVVQTSTITPLSLTPISPNTPFALHIQPALQASILPAIQLPDDLPLAADPTKASLNIFVGQDYPVSQWIFVLVAPFPTTADGVSYQDLRDAWEGKSSGAFSDIPLLMSESTLEILSSYWGQPEEGAVNVRSSEKLLNIAWEQKPSWAIIPFEQLNPEWKVFSIDGISPIHKDFDIDNYDLAIPISMTGVAPELPKIPSSNRNPEKMTVLAMTGVTALVRATAFTMEQQGVTYPASDIGSILLSADITHISNEVPFAENCPFPNPVQEDMRFCSRTKYIELLESIDTDIVELTGDHFADWGAEAMYYTLDLYDQRGWPYYGGGANFNEGRKPVVIEHNGNKLAFIGCNAKGGGYATASDSSPGAAYCDWNWMEQTIAELRTEDYLPIATFQHFEYYTYTAQPNQTRDADRMIKAGAVIVSGSQAHQPQAFEFLQGSLTHHGLGNLFFDQLDVSEATRQGFIDLHVFYDGRYISTELVTIYFIDYARARLMNPQERTNLLQAVFSASGW